MPVSTVITGILAALAMKGAEKLTEKAAESAFENRSQIVTSLKTVLLGSELTTLDLLEKHPENKDIQNEFIKIVRPKLETNPVIFGELERLVQPFLVINKSENNIAQEGERNVAIQNARDNTITISQS